MPSPDDKALADRLYAEGMAHNWRHGESPAQAALSRANFERSAALGHTKALRELAEMMFGGSGGVKQPERALGLKWTAFMRGDREALEELSALLESYGEQVQDAGTRRLAEALAQRAERASHDLVAIESFILSQAREAGLGDRPAGAAPGG